MRDEEHSESKKTARDVFKRQEDQHRQLLKQALGPGKAMQDALDRVTGLSHVQQMLLDRQTSRIAKAALETENTAARMAKLTEFTDPLHKFREAFKDSPVFRLQEEMRDVARMSSIAKLTAELETAAASLTASFTLNLPDISKFAKIDSDALRFENMEVLKMREYTPPVLRQPVPEPGEAAKILAKLQSDFEPICEEHAHNPSKHPAMIVMLADGKEIYIETVRNVGDQSVEVIGFECRSGDRRELTVGIGIASFYTRVFEIGPRKPNLLVIEDDKPEDE